jgi:hypothetical protein
MSQLKDKDRESNLIKCHQINDKSEGNSENKHFRTSKNKKKFITTMARPPSQADEKST